MRTREREFQISQMVRMARQLAAVQLVSGSSGNISVRDKATMLIKASGVWMEEARACDFVKLGLEGQPSGTSRKRPSCEYRLHAACYRKRSDISCVMHTHPFYATVLVSCKMKPKIVIPEAAAELGSVPGCIDYRCPGTDELARAVGRCAKTHNVIFMRNHGVVAVGKSLREAYVRTIISERLAKMQIIAALLHRQMKQIDVRALQRHMARAGRAI